MAFLSSFRTVSVQALVAVLAIAQPSDASPSIAAWWTPNAPQVMVQNETTGAIQYSYCNSNGTPIYPVDPPNVLPVGAAFKPRNGTALTGVGWWDGNTTVASMWYQDENLEIVNTLLTCDWTTGQFTRTGSWVISAGAITPHPTTGLGSLLLGSSAGYRVYYHDVRLGIRVIYYSNDRGWAYHGKVSVDKMATTAIGVTLGDQGNANITVVSPRDDKNMEASNLNTDASFWTSTFPRPLEGHPTSKTANVSADYVLNTTAITKFTLPALGTPKSVGITTAEDNTRSVWYIGSDRQLYSTSSRSNVWSRDDKQSTVFWPQADEPNAPAGITSDFSSSQVRIYYFVSGLLTEVKLAEDGVWKEARPLATSNTTATAPESSTPTVVSPSNSTATGGAQPDETVTPTGLSSGAKAGVGVGVALGVLFLAGLIGAVFYFRRRAAAAARNSEKQDMAQSNTTPGSAGEASVAYDANGNPVYAPSYPGSPSPGADGKAWDNKQALATHSPDGTPVSPVQQLDGRAVYQELEGPREMYELPGQTYSELAGDHRTGHGLPGTNVAVKHEVGK